jgi:hypothetical protein
MCAVLAYGVLVYECCQLSIGAVITSASHAQWLTLHAHCWCCTQPLAHLQEMPAAAGGYVALLRRFALIFGIGLTLTALKPACCHCPLHTQPQQQHTPSVNSVCNQDVTRPRTLNIMWLHPICRHCLLHKPFHSQPQQQVNTLMPACRCKINPTCCLCLCPTCCHCHCPPQINPKPHLLPLPLPPAASLPAAAASPQSPPAA